MAAKLLNEICKKPIVGICCVWDQRHGRRTKNEIYDGYYLCATYSEKEKETCDTCVHHTFTCVRFGLGRGKKRRRRRIAIERRVSKNNNNSKNKKRESFWKILYTFSSQKKNAFVAVEQ